jgi:hypothetical protein
MVSQAIWVYVIGRRGGPCKVGVSADPAERLQAVQTGCAFEVAVWGQFPFASRLLAIRFERRAHAALGRHRLAGEWFDVEPETAIGAIETAPGYTKYWLRGAE